MKWNSRSWLRNEQWRIGLVLVLMALILILISLLGCASVPAVTTGLCRELETQTWNDAAIAADPVGYQITLRNEARLMCACHGDCPDEGR